MSKRTTTDIKRRSGLEMRAQRDQRLGQPYELQEAGRREASFLKNITGAQDDLEWILTNRAWTQLGFERVAEWWDAKVGPVLDGLDLKPSQAMVERVIRTIVADEAELPKVQRRTQREIASIARASQSKVSRLLADAPSSTTDLDKDSGGAGGEDADVSGQEPPADIPTSQVALVAGQPGSYSPVAPGEAPIRSGAVPPSAVGAVGDEPEGPATPSGDPNITEEQAPTSPVEPVLSLSGAGVSLDGDEVEEEPAGQQGSSSTDPAAEFMVSWRGFVQFVVGADREVIGPMLTDDEYGELEDDYTHLGELLAKMRQGS